MIRKAFIYVRGQDCASASYGADGGRFARRLRAGRYTHFWGVSMKRLELFPVLVVGMFAVSCAVQEEGPTVQSEAEVNVENGVVEVAGGRLYYEIAGAGEPVVLVHGNFGDRRHWDDQFSAFASRYRVLRYDVRGFGKSSLPVEGVAYADHEDLAELLKHLDIPSAHVVGFSMGSGIAIDFVFAYPSMSKSLVSVGPWVFGYSSPTANDLFQDLAEVTSVLEDQGVPAAVDYSMTQTFFNETIRDPLTQNRVRAIMNDFPFWSFTHENPGRRLKPRAVERTDRIDIPTLIVTAEHDVPVCLEIADFLEQTVPGSKKAILSRTGHFMMMEKPNEFNRILLNFFERTREPT